MKENEKINPLGTAPVPKLMASFAIPSIIGMLVSALYNIVDQLFIGRGVGTDGKEAGRAHLLRPEFDQKQQCGHGGHHRRSL